MEGLFGFRNREASAQTSRSSYFSKPASIRLYQGGAIFHDR